jgi:hypothetical protein
MGKRVSVAEASLHLPELLDEVQEERTTFVIVRGDKEIGQLAPVASMEPAPLDDFIKVLQEFAGKDPEFADDLEEIRARQPLLGDSPWPS